jgi:hypothetical protein
MMKTSRSILAAVIAGGALLTGSTAFAQVDSAMIHGPAMQRDYAQPHMVNAAVVINLGWHGDRYWDGHRYWARDDWMRDHPHDHGPYHHHDHGDHHDDHGHHG